MPTLSDYTNVYNQAIGVLDALGYQVWFDRQSQLFYAEKDGWDFAADSPTALLGVVKIFEFVQPTECSEYWWRTLEGTRDFTSLPETPPTPYVSRVKRK